MAISVLGSRLFAWRGAGEPVVASNSPAERPATWQRDALTLSAPAGAGALEPIGGGLPGSKIDAFIAAAMRFEGQEYVWGGGHTSRTFTRPAGVDCSGLVQQAMRMAGMNLDGTAAIQQDKGRSVSMNDLRKGDLLFHGNPASHVGIYIGNGKAIHASSTNDRIMVVSLSAYTYFDSARRVFDQAGGREPKPSDADKPKPKPPQPDRKPDHDDDDDRKPRHPRPDRPAPAPGAVATAPQLEQLAQLQAQVAAIAGQLDALLRVA